MIDVWSFSQAWSARLADDALAREVIETLWARRESFVQQAIQRTRNENPTLDAVVAEELEEKRAHLLAHLQAIFALPRGRVGDLGDDPLAFVRRLGVRRAQGGVPLQAVLQGYRNGHRSFWRAMCDIIQQQVACPEAGIRLTMLLSEFCIDYTDLISVVVTDSFLQEGAKLAEECTRLCLAVVDDLLNGCAPRLEQGWRLCQELGLADDHPMVVVVARPLTQSDSALAARALSLLARGLETCLPRARFGRIVGVRAGEVIAVVAAATEPAERTTQELRQAAQSIGSEAGPFRIGVGLDVSSITALPASYRQAVIALNLRLGGAVSHLAEAQIDDYLRQTADATARRLAPPLPLSIREGELGRTIEAFAAADLNVKACARNLGVHNNTIYHRLNQVHRLTGTDPRTYGGLTTLVTALAIARRPT